MGVRMGIENISAVIDTGSPIDLDRVHSCFGNAKMHAQKAKMISYRIRKPKAFVEIFASGKITMSGLVTMDEVKSAGAAVLRDLEPAGVIPPEDPEPRIYNMVASGDAGASLDLPDLLLNLGTDRAEYEPEQFPGLIYRMDDPQVTVLLFSSGRMVCTGSPDPAEISRAADIIFGKLQEILRTKTA
ncbi:MAG: TATA-box-binding protein [Candidatus Methanomethylophilaceae archaeon]|nr:TATA-box-binding protein [Candidatus Methanomethylophilaceae archaeon]